MCPSTAPPPVEVSPRPGDRSARDQAPRLSRRALLGGALASAGLLALAPACSSSGGTEADPLKALGRSLAKGPDGPRLRSSPPAGLTMPLRDQTQLLHLLDSLDASIRADFADGRTVLADGWLLAETEAAALVAYARA